MIYLTEIFIINEQQSNVLENIVNNFTLFGNQSTIKKKTHLCQNVQ